MARKAPDPMKALAIAAQATGRGRGRRSPLYLWFRQHHATLAEGFKRTPPGWADVAAYLGSEGVLDIDGKPPTARAAQDTWHRVRREMEAEASCKAVPAPSTPLPAPGEIAPGVRAIVPTDPQPGRAERPRVKVELRPAVPLDAIPPASILEQPKQATQDEPKDTSHAAETDERIKAVLDELGGRRRLGNKMPKQVE